MIRTSVRVDGVAKTLKVLKGLDPDIRKQFNKDAKEILRPVVDDAKGRYPDVYLSGMSRSWQTGRIFPYTQARAKRGVKVSVKQEKDGTLLKIVQTDAAASVVDYAGSSTSNQLGRNLSTRYGHPSRVMWPAFVAHANDIQTGIQNLVDGVATRANVELKL